MNARERVIAAIQHKEPDRLPVDFYTTPSSGISAIDYDQLKTYLRICGPTRVYGVVPPSDPVITNRKTLIEMKHLKESIRYALIFLHSLHSLHPY